MENEARELLINGSKELGLSLSQGQFRQFDTYLNNLKFFNKKVNLTTIKEDKEIVIKHFLDSLSVFKSGVIKEGQWIVDIGAGAGFPGIPVKIIQPKTTLYLVESNNKKTLFLDIITKKLGLGGLSIINSRIETFGQGFGRDKFDIVLGRAIAELPVLLEYSIPLLKKEAYLIAMKAKLGSDEKNKAKKACGIINCDIEKDMEVTVPYLEASRRLVVVKKTWGTPKQYPRRPGAPKKKPLA
jgi:16S rRNA (guanine527-N7)-methyltransferase